MKAEIDSGEPKAALDVPIADVLGRVGHELAHLARLLEHFESIAAPLALEAARRDVDLMREMQGLDHIGQKLSALADFLAALAPAASKRWMVHPSAAARVVRLADLAARLGFSDGNEASCAAAWGDVELL
ncbi:MAG: hypothetical protein WDN46_25510 [Methylocella sp.]